MAENGSDEWINGTYIPSLNDEISIKFVFFTLFISLVVITGFIGNSVLIIIIIRTKDMRTVPNFFILSLAVCDILHLTVIGIMATYQLWMTTIDSSYVFPWTVASCRIINTVFVIFQAASVNTLMALSIERYRAVFCWKPRPGDRKQSFLKHSLCIALIWAVAISFAIPAYIKTGTLFLNGYYTCEMFVIGSTSAKVYESMRLVILNIVPLVITCGCYFNIMIKLLRSTNLRVQPSFIKRRRKLAVIMPALILLVTASWSPYISTEWVREFHDVLNFTNKNWSLLYKFHMAGFYLSIINAAIDPLILCVISRKFRHYMLCRLDCFTYKHKLIPSTQETVRTSSFV
ncbi:QRFP-like peptide receptor [Anneissia japonica]|uniref:QRFP-like peptide receptor n=1 Tax=Anneissia japonica TaxID=1529436 RepID=UPI0014257F22|nr:QRFP-like peptide receptor [Anneissia japonica]